MRILLLSVVCWSLFSLAATAAEVQIRHQGLSLNARLVMPEESGLANEVTVLVHDSLGNQDDAAIRGLQKALLTAERSSLAITLALSVDDRQERFDCARAHLHRHMDAIAEIAAWVHWLREQGAQRINLLGLGRGANQVAWYASTRPGAKAALGDGAILLLNPTVRQANQAAIHHQGEFGYSLEPLLHHARRLLRRDQPRELIHRVDFLGCQDTTVSAASLISYYGDESRHHTPDLLDSFEAPALVLADANTEAGSILVSELATRAYGERLQLRLILSQTADARLETFAAAVLGYLAHRQTLLADNSSE